MSKFEEQKKEVKKQHDIEASIKESEANKSSGGDSGHGTVTTVQDIKMEQKETFGSEPGTAKVGYSNINGQRICSRCGLTFLSDGDAENHIKVSHRPVSEVEAEEKKRAEEVKAEREARIAERKARLK